MWNSEELNEHLLDGWEKSLTAAGVPFYTNHKREKTEWDHPILTKTMEELVDMDAIKYAAYRTAMKLRFLQKRFKLDLIELSTLSMVLERHGQGVGSGGEVSSVRCPALLKLLTDLFTLCRKSAPTITGAVNADTAAELLQNFLLNLYDKSRTGRVRITAVKVALATLCSGRLSEKYKFFFKHISDRTQHVSKQRMGIFLTDLIQVADILNESASFGGMNVAPAVENCFSMSWSSAGLTEDEFTSWLLKEPQTMVWLPTMHRMAAAETVRHDAKCQCCKACPIIGFRYRCLKCFNYDLCQQCFFTGRTSKNHKLKHPTQEYCLSTSTKEDTKALMRTIRNNLSKKHRNKRKLRYVPIEAVPGQPYDPDQFSVASSEQSPEASPQPSPQRRPVAVSVVVDTQHQHHQQQQGSTPRSQARSPQPTDTLRLNSAERIELGNIVRQLEAENRELMQEIERLHVTSPPPDHSSSSSSSSGDSEAEWLRDEKERLAAKQEVLEAHNRQLEMQLVRLREILKAQPSAQHDLSPIPNNVTPMHPTPAPPVTPATPGTPGSLAVDETLGSMMMDENTLLQSHFSLPSPNRSRNYPEEEAQLEELMQKLDQAYIISSPPQNLSFYDNQGGLEEMYRAANKIGDAFSEFVGTAAQDIPPYEPSVDGSAC